ncbi:hypothetical protein B0I37DRAFT_139299 [Chaetomium sp. MPI-CAGE-AT-0009]|nr:hypothetical protein B0I37DRAFT_139299 [Chaetomium sp. MPI-CAGE-AT-0009]
MPQRRADDSVGQLSLWCATEWTAVRPLKGSTFVNCCCDGQEVDLCRNCVLLKERTCYDDDHLLAWGIRPIPMSGFSIERLEKQLSADLPQNIVIGNSAWMSSVENPSRLSISASRFHQAMSERQKVQAALEKGEVTVKVDLDVPGYCDFCLRTVQHIKHYIACLTIPRRAFPDWHCAGSAGKLDYRARPGMTCSLQMPSLASAREQMPIPIVSTSSVMGAKHEL